MSTLRILPWSVRFESPCLAGAGGTTGRAASVRRLSRRHSHDRRSLASQGQHDPETPRRRARRQGEHRFWFRYQHLARLFARSKLIFEPWQQRPGDLFCVSAPPNKSNQKEEPASSSCACRWQHNRCRVMRVS